MEAQSGCRFRNRSRARSRRNTRKDKEMATHSSRPVTITDEEWNGSNIDDIKALAGEENVSLVGDILQVRKSDGIWENVRIGWRVARKQDNHVISVISASAFREFWE